ncbi:hypothetical protein TNIN_265681 [Trichonephila inaurata madagascariensis]|uniref:Uncharacterized protein n=1 Tax=Trichonephila inaurata madagascariensis TaxID=2747483 RepID=A0A8X6WLH2_9ARAC|nr:hypothetical protein TNIN_265681 [Trichonephila inaurata madagascariensis]
MEFFNFHASEHVKAVSLGIPFVGKLQIDIIRCRAHSEQAPFEEEDDGKKLPRCCCPLMTAHEQSEDKIPAQKVQGFKS